MSKAKTIVVSGVNIRKGGTLTIMRQCLEYLSHLSATEGFRIIALVHDKTLYPYSNIEYLEFPDTIISWGKRLWCEYVTMKKVAQGIGHIDLWFSLHDTTPNVTADRQAVYCQTSFPFFKWKMQDFRFDFKIPLFAMFTRFAYRINVHRNNYLIVQQEWLREGLSKMLGVPPAQFIVAPPEHNNQRLFKESENHSTATFIYAATPDCHKNFETLCKAAELLEDEKGKDHFKVVLTLKGNENSYARWLHDRWGHVTSIEFAGFMTKERLYQTYNDSCCLVFPSRVETWGLPISEYMGTGHPMILSDLPYAHETAAGSRLTTFFTFNDAHALKEKMKAVLDNDLSDFHPIERSASAPPVAASWEEIFKILLNG